MKPFMTCLWFDKNGEDAAKFYTSIFPNSKILKTDYYPEAGNDVHGQKPGTVMTVTFELNGQPFMALNGGPHFKLSEAVSFIISCKDQAEIDSYFEKLSAVPESAQCGWVKDKFGVSWQIMPENMDQIMSGPNREAAFAAMMDMKKIDIAALKTAAQSQKAA